MSDYVKVKNYAKDGDIAISRRVFEELATEAANRVIGAEVSKVKSKNKILVKLYRPTKVTFRSDGKVEIKISITIAKGANANEVCLKIQEEVAQSLLFYTESVPFDIEIKVDSIA